MFTLPKPLVLSELLSDAIYPLKLKLTSIDSPGEPHTVCCHVRAGDAVCFDRVAFRPSHFQVDVQFGSQMCITQV
jgi:hypothetical protein